jgi:CheY-like chemotaxis protein
LPHTHAVTRLLSILIVDDSANMRRVIRLLIKDLAREITKCDDGSKVLTTYRVHQPDWVFMDIRMKKTGGLTATRQIKAAYPDARIVMVTLYKEDDLQEAVQAAGACAYVVNDNLLEIRRILAQQSVFKSQQHAESFSPGI